MTPEEGDHYEQLGYMLGYSLGRGIREGMDRRHNEDLLQRAQQVVQYWQSRYFDSVRPILPGETRSGVILFASAAVQPQTPLKVLLFIGNPSTGTDEQMTFDFN